MVKRALLGAMLALYGCGSVTTADDEGDADVDVDVDADTDSDTETDSDTGTDTGTDTGSGTGTPDPCVDVDCSGGTCRDGVCCRGCWSGDVCADGQTEQSACGAGGVDCRACSGSGTYDCTGDCGDRAAWTPAHCKAGVCVSDSQVCCPNEGDQCDSASGCYQ